MAKKNAAWVDEPYVQKILQNSENDKTIQVSGITSKPATAKGENYGSEMHRVMVEFTRIRDGRKIQEKKSLIVKAMPSGEMAEEMMKSTGIFATELLMMSVTLPRMSELLETVCSASLCARCLYIQYEEPTHLVIEDLAPRGFRLADRHAGLDLDHCLLAIRNIGRFHAASIALKEKDPEAFAQYKDVIHERDSLPMMRHFTNAGAKTLAGETAKWPELDASITEKLLKLSNVLFDKRCAAAAYREDDFNVLNHGDCWINNMLFYYDENRKPNDHIFVDFQIPFYGSPAIDLLYFFGTSPTNEIRLNDRELLLHEYHTSLSSTVAALGCSTVALSFDKLQETLKNRVLYEIVATMTVLPVVLLEKGEELDLEAIVVLDEGYTNPSYGGKTYREIMTKLLPLYDGMGLLDV